MEHLIFLLWKIQYYLDSNKGGKLLVQYVAWLVTQKQLSVPLPLRHLPHVAPSLKKN